MSRVHRPGNYPLPTTPLALLIGLWATAGAAWLLWFSGRLASLLAGHGWSNGPGFGSGFFASLLRGDWS